jgi:hypothetical protein
MAIIIRTMTGRDVPLGMALTDRAGWNQTEADWLRLPGPRTADRGQARCGKMFWQQP